MGAPTKDTKPEGEKKTMKKFYILRSELKETQTNPKLFELINQLKNEVVFLWSKDENNQRKLLTSGIIDTPQGEKNYSYVKFDQNLFDNELFKKYAFNEVLEYTENRTSDNQKYYITSIDLLLKI